MEIVILSNPLEVCQQAARLMAQLVRETPTAVLGLATGSTPQGVYLELVRLHREGDLDFSRVTTFNLDEYVGLDGSHRCSYRHYMTEHLFRHVNIPEENIHTPDGMSATISRFCTEYELAIAESGGIDLQLLGLGEDGHIGFNEPVSSLASRTRIKTLTDSTVEANQGAFGPDGVMPRHVITMGVGTILEARRCLMLAYGARKAEAVARMVEGPVTAFVPASALQLHPDTVVLLDEAAASELKLKDYYRSVYRHKPEWQRFP